MKRTRSKKSRDTVPVSLIGTKVKRCERLGKDDLQGGFAAIGIFCATLLKSKENQSMLSNQSIIIFLL
jgi:hypothetical protein